jgi:drug/metabolite transporter (DMT)-like permease
MTVGVVWAVLAGISFGFAQLSHRGVNRQTDALTATAAIVTAMFATLLVASAVSGELTTISSVPFAALAWFVAAALVRFGFGWILLALSQQKIGPSRTASVLSTNPVMAALISAVAIGQELRPITWVGVVAVTVGVAAVSTARGDEPRARTGGLAIALGAALMFSIAPTLVTIGLEDVEKPLLGLTIGIGFSVPCLHLMKRVSSGGWVRVERPMLGWLAFGGLSAGFAITALWNALDLIPVGVAVSIQQLSTPVVLFAGPVLLSEPRERPSARLLGGTGLILAGAVLVAVFGRHLS